MISENKKVDDLDWISEITPTKFERTRARVKDLVRRDKHYMRNEWDSGRQEAEEEEEVRILIM